jgi:hypothetical protein
LENPRSDTGPAWIFTLTSGTHSLGFSHLNLMYHYIGMMIAALISFKLPAHRRVQAEHNYCPQKYSTPDPDV